MGTNASAIRTKNNHQKATQINVLLRPSNSSGVTYLYLSDNSASVGYGGFPCFASLLKTSHVEKLRFFRLCGSLFAEARGKLASGLQAAESLRGAVPYNDFIMLKS